MFSVRPLSIIISFYTNSNFSLLSFLSRTLNQPNNIINNYDFVFLAETCDSVNCPDGKKCKIRNGRPRCVCAPDCSTSNIRHRGAICGTDGRTYRNHCAMLKYNCRHSANVGVEYFGRCQSKFHLDLIYF